MSGKVRVAKARKRSTCPACRGPVVPGQQVTPGAGRGPWRHLDCDAAASRAADLAAARLGRPVETLLRSL